MGNEFNFGVKKLFKDLNFSADVVDGRVAHVGTVFLIQAAVQVILHTGVVGGFAGRLKALDTRFAFLDIAFALLYGFIEFAVFLLQIDCRCS